jgi:hypothetical protein
LRCDAPPGEDDGFNEAVLCMDFSLDICYRKMCALDPTFVGVYLDFRLVSTTVSAPLYLPEADSNYVLLFPFC